MLRYTECHCTACRYTKCRYTECHYTVCHYIECHTECYLSVIILSKSTSLQYYDFNCCSKKLYCACHWKSLCVKLAKKSMEEHVYEFSFTEEGATEKVIYKFQNIE